MTSTTTSGSSEELGAPTFMDMAGHSLGATGAPGEVTKLATFGTVAAPIVVAVGLGDEPGGSAPAPETLRRGTGAANLDARSVRIRDDG